MTIGWEEWVATQVATLLRRFDPEHGGFDLAPKLPHAEALTLLLRQWRLSGDPRLVQIVRRSLDALAERLWDPADGGFFRCAAAADWSQPHTEKITTDQASLIRLFTEAWQRLGEPRYLKLSAEAGAYALGRLTAVSGGFFGSQAAAPDYYRLPAERRHEADSPPVDGVVFADATAFLAAALFYASAVLELPEWEACGRVALKRLMARAPDGRIPHTLSGTSAVHGLLGDQALGLRAALGGYQISGEREPLEWATRVAEWSITNLWNPDGHAVSDFSSDGRPLGYLARPLAPILPNAELAEAFFDLDTLTGQSRFGEVARTLVAGLEREAGDSLVGPALALVVSRQAEDRIDALVRGESADPRARELARALVRIAGPTTVIRWESGSPASITLCTRSLCLPPIEDSRELSDSLSDLGLLA